MEKDKAARIEFEKRRVAALAVLRQQKPIDNLSNDELDAVLLYHGVQKSKMGRQSERKEKWRKILEREGKLPFLPRWTKKDETKLQAYKDKPIDVGLFYVLSTYKSYL